MPTVTPPIMLRMKHRKMVPLNNARTPCHRNRSSIQPPRNRPAARSRKKIEILYADNQTEGPR